MLRVVLFLIAFLTGLFLIFYSPQKEMTQTSESVLAEVVSLVGNAALKNNGEYSFSALKVGQKLSTLATLVTEAQSRIRLKVRGQSVIEVEPLTQAILDDSKDKKIVEIVVLHGHIQVVQSGTLNSLRLYQKDKISSESNASSTPELPTSHATPLQQLPQKIVHTETIIPEALKPDQTLSSEYIRAVLEDQRRFVQSCYLKYFNSRKGNVQIGRLLLNFLIEPSGKTKNVRIVKSEIDDQPFHDCIKSIIARTKFRSFQSSPIDMEYPIDIVLPE